MYSHRRARTKKPRYPALDPATVALINSRLTEIVSLQHAEGLSQEQQAELAACVALQTHYTEELHRFELENHDAPAFMIDPERLKTHG